MSFKISYSDEYFKHKDNLNIKKLINLSDVIIIGAPHKKYLKLKLPKNKILINVWQ